MTDEVKSESAKKNEDWMNAKWRPMMGWMYMLVCTMDMVIFPILWSLLQTFTHTNITQWSPLTLQGAGLFHIAMGAVLGIAAFGRTQEKLGGANNGGLQTSGTGFSGGATTFSQPSAGYSSASGSVYSPVSTGFGTAPTTSSFGGSGFGSAPAPVPAQVMTGFGGKPAPAPAFQPEI